MERNIQKLRESPHWSFSAFNTYLSCPLKFYFQYIKHEKPERTASCFAFGRAFHTALSERALKGSRLTEDDANDIFAVFFKAEVNATENLVYKQNETYDSLLQNGFDMLALVLANWQDDFAVKSVAECFSVELPGLSKPLIGEFDMVVKDGSNDCIVDWKTSSSKWPPGKADRDLQATVFSYAYTQLYGKNPLFRFDVVTKTKTPSLESYYTQRTADQFERFLYLATRIEACVEKEIFIPNETCFSCTDCSYARRCKNIHRKAR